MADYTLPDIIIKGETYTIELLNAVAGLSLPERTLITGLNPKQEKIDGNNVMGAIMPENLRIDFKDPDGFFYDLLADEVDIKISRAGYGVEFYGRVDRKASKDWNEYYVTDATAKRDASLICTSKINALRDKSADFILQKIILDDANHPVVKVYNVALTFTDAYVKVTDLFKAVMLDGLGVSTTYAGPVVDVEDFQYFTSDLFTEHYINDLYVRVGTTTSSSAFTPEDYFDDNSDNYLGKKYSSALDLLSAFARTFGFIPRIIWDDANDTFRLHLRPRRHRTAGISSDPLTKRMQSRKTRISSIYPETFIFRPPLDTNNSAWYDPEPRPWNYSGGINLGPSSTPEGVSFDYDAELLWGAVNDVSPTVSANILLHYPSTPFTVFVEIQYLRHYDHIAEEWSTAYSRSTYAHLYYYHPQWTGEKEEYTRTFKGFTSNSVLSIVEIHNGVENKEFFINGFERNYEEKSETYHLIEV